MGKSSPKPPPAPDYAAAAAAQGAANKDAAIASQEMSMVDQVTPYGTLTYKAIGTSPSGNQRYQATQALSAEQQALLDASNRTSQLYADTANQQLGRAQTTLAEPVDYASFGVAPTFDQAFRQQQADMMLQRVQPQMEQRRAAIETQLANQGLQPGTEAYNRAVDQFYRSQNDMMMAIDANAGNEAARQFQLQGSARDRQINEALQRRNQIINETAALASGGQVQNPQFIGTPGAQVAAPDIIGSTVAGNSAANQNYAAQMQATSAANQGLYSLLGAGLGAGGMYFGGR